MKTFFELTDNMSLYTPEFIRSACQKLSLKARCLYELLLRRTGLSIHNGEKMVYAESGGLRDLPQRGGGKDAELLPSHNHLSFPSIGQRQPNF